MNLEFYLTNTYFTNVEIYEKILRIYLSSRVIISNIVFSNFSFAREGMIETFYCFAVVINTMRLENIYYDKSVQHRVIFLSNFNFTYTSIQNVYLNNVTLFDHPLVSNIDLITQVTIAN